MIIEHWYDDVSTGCFIKGDQRNMEVMMKVAVGPMVKCCEIEGESWEDCMAKYHDHMGWEPYVPMVDKEDE